MPNPAAELRHLEGILMRWPRDVRIQLKIQELRRQIERQRQARAGKMRGQIRRDLMTADLDTLARIAREFSLENGNQ